MTYSQLVAEIQSYTENTFQTVDINTFITQAEQRIYNSVQLPALRKNVTGTTTSGNKYLAMPTDWLATFSLAIINASNEYTYLLNKDVNFIRQSFPDTDSEFYGTPEYYAVFDNSAFILGPTPDASYAVELHYFYYPTSIVTAGTTWLGDNFSSTLLLLIFLLNWSLDSFMNSLGSYNNCSSLSSGIPLIPINFLKDFYHFLMNSFCLVMV